MSLFKSTVGGAVFAALVTFALPLAGAPAAMFGASEARADVVGSIVVQGNQRIDAETVRNYVQISPGKQFGATQINESVKALYATGLFSDVKIDRRGNSLVVSVRENSVISTVRFEGNSKIKSKQLEAIIETKPRGMLSDVKLQGDVERIKGYYAHSGRAGATVAYAVNNGQAGRVDVVFKIDEGKRSGISDISFVGNNAYSDRRLRSVINTKETNWLSWFTKKDVYDQAKVDADQELLRRFYMRNGYADFRVLGADVQFDEASARYHITFTVEEGPRYKIGQVAIDSSIPGIDEASLRSQLKTQPGRTFNSTEIEKSQENVTIELANRGYSFAQVRPRGDRDPATSTINLTYLIDEGPRVYVERIDIRGNTKTRDYVIRREFELSEGDAYNRVLVDKVERRLRALGFFKTVAINAEPGTRADRVVLVVNVEEQPTGDFSIAGGYSSNNGPIAEISMTEKNFLGRGQYLKVSFGMGLSDTSSNQLNLSFTEPYFMGRRMAAGFDAYRRVSSSTSYRPYASEQVGGGVRLGLPITDEFDLQLNYKINSTSISSSKSTYFPDGDYLTSSVGYQATFSTIDNKQDPHSGIFLRASQDFAGVGGDAYYIRSLGEARLYQELLPQTDVIGLLKVSGGNITGLDGDLRVSDNFFKGGELVRGFASLGLGARDTSDGTSLGGKNFWAATAEVQFPLPIVPDDFGLRGAVFADAGAVWGVDATGTIADSDAIRSSVGASILWASPFGLIRADFAHVLTKADQDKEQFFRFSAGTQF